MKGYFFVINLKPVKDILLWFLVLAGLVLSPLVISKMYIGGLKPFF